MNAYRYGFNSEEKIDEWNEGNYDLGARFYDVRLGRMFSSDPKEAAYPWQSTYAYNSNSPIWIVDVNGEGKGDPAPGELASTPESDKKYSKQSNQQKKDQLKSLKSPNGTYFIVPSTAKYTYSDGEQHQNQTKKEGVWSITYENGDNYMWDHQKGNYVLNTSDRGGGENWIPHDYDFLPMGSIGYTYAGSDNPILDGSENKDDWSQPCQNLADAAGKVHDQDYAKDNLAGFSGIMDAKSTAANYKLMGSCLKIIQMYNNGEIDPYTGVPVSYGAFRMAEAMYTNFARAESLKAYIEVKKKQIIKSGAKARLI